MADEKITGLAAGTPKDTDYLVAVDTTDVSMAPSGTDKKYLNSSQKTYYQTAFEGTAREFHMPTQIFEHASSGLHSGGVVTINGGDPTKFDVAQGAGDILDQVSLTFDSITWVTTTAITPISSDAVIYVYVDVTSTISQTLTQPDSQFYRDNVVLGRVVVRSGTVIAAQMQPNLDLQVANQIVDSNLALGILNYSGNNISPNGANLKLDKSAGQLYGQGINYANNMDIPHLKSISSASPTTFQMTTQLAATGVNITDLDVGNYDVGGVITPVGGGPNASTNFRVFLFPTGNIRIAYGQNTYVTLDKAISEIPFESFVINPSYPGNACLIAIISVKNTATDLSDTTQARIFKVSKFGDVGIGAAGTSVSSLQDAYNNGATPTIEVTTARSGVEFKDSATPATFISSWTDNAGTTTYVSIDNTGAHFFNSGTASGLNLKDSTGVFDFNIYTTTAATANRKFNLILSDTDTSLNVGWFNQSLLTTDTPTFNDVTVNGVRLLGASNYLRLISGEALTAARTLQILVSDASHTVTFQGSPTLNDWFDQSVKTTANVAFNNLKMTNTEVTGSANATTFMTEVDTSVAGTKNITLLSADAAVPGTIRIICDKGTGALTNFTDIVTQGSETIDGQSSIRLSPYSSYGLMANNDGNWNIFSQFSNLQRYILAGNFTNVTASLTNSPMSFYAQSGHISDFYCFRSGYISKFYLAVDPDASYTAWTTGTLQFIIRRTPSPYTTPVTLYSSSAFSPASYAGSAIGVNALLIILNIQLVYFAGDILSFEVTTNGTFNGTGMEVGIVAEMQDFAL